MKLKLSLVITALAFFSSIASQAKPLSVSVGVKGSQLKFTVETITVKKGQEVDLTFSNDAPKDSGMSHNWVLVNTGKGQDVATKGIEAGPDKGYTPESSDILAKTKMLPPSEKETIHFTAPKVAGEYPFICTFPGHFPTMKGTWIVQ